MSTSKRDTEKDYDYVFAPADGVAHKIDDSLRDDREVWKNLHNPKNLRMNHLFDDFHI